MHSNHSRTGDVKGAHQDFFDLFGFVRLALEPTQEPGAHSRSRNSKSGKHTSRVKLQSIASIKKALLSDYAVFKNAALFPGLQRYYESDGYRLECAKAHRRRLLPHVYQENWRQRVERRRKCFDSFSERHGVGKALQTFDALIHDLKSLGLLGEKERVKWWDNLKSEIKYTHRKR
jgi:hypothetical protein